ncbi:hypothetical protein [Acinetobacter pragensis]|uniref:hypothetical protein n=1 Tax=Acinetobacter pragensis TaxID=1806892 RepID=UPI00333E7C62
MKKFETLQREYLNILSELDESFINEKYQNSKKDEGLSGLFLASEPENYWFAKNKIMVIGAETREWNVKLDTEYSLEQYLLSSVEKNKSFFQKMMNEPRTQQITFHDFTRAIADRCGRDGLIYSNLFCFAWNAKSPIKTKYFDQIKNVSFKLLKAQLEYFEPQIIIFANGSQNTVYRREIFDSKLYSEGQDYINEGISKNHLYQFLFADKYQCYRIQHPSTIRGRKMAISARKKLIEILPSI